MRCGVKASAYRELSDDELEERHRERVKEHFDLRMKRSSGKLDNPLQLRVLKREIARVRTIQNERKRSKR